MHSNLNDSCYPTVQISEKENKNKFIFLFLHDKFMKMGMHSPHVIPDMLTKWHI
jgi:hypothetical protein